MEVIGSNNPHNGAHVDNAGRLETHSVSISEQSGASIEGDAYNLNTGTFTLTSDVETPLLYIKNDSESRDIVIPRIFITTGVSTGGSGVMESCVIANPTGGTIVTGGVDNPPSNFNFGDSKALAVTSKIGATGLTFIGGVVPIEFLFPSAPLRTLIGFESIVLPRGASLILTLTPPVGNTSMMVQAGANLYLTGLD